MTETRITVTGDTIGVEHLDLTDAALAAFVGETPESERGQLAERALRIGLLTLCNAGVNMSADVVKAEFERLYERMETTQQHAADTLAATLREHFGDGDGLRLAQLLDRLGRAWLERHAGLSVGRCAPVASPGPPRRS